MSSAKMTIGGLEVVRLLGKGGMSEVYEAVDARLGSRHAVKIYAYSGEDQDVRRRFEVEGRLLAKLNHPRIVKVTDIGVDEGSGRPYFVMDLVADADGKVVSLADIPAGEADEVMVGRWYDDIRDGLAYIHGKGVIHRDLKLQNVLIGPDGHAVLTDFGISKIGDMSDGERSVVDPVQTIVRIQDGKRPVMGSIGYMAPELEMGVAASPQSDWYALGVIVYKLLTGTWCDSRTNVGEALSTYDPAWMRIVPLLLHANPQGRECRSFAEERERCREEAEMKAESRFLKEKRRGHVARHVARYFAGVMLVMATVLGLMLRDRIKRLDEAERKLAYDFASVFEIPPAAKDEPGPKMPSRDDFRLAMIDALVLTQDLFADLREGVITPAKARVELRRLCAKAQKDDEDEDLFAGLPDGFAQSGDNEPLAILLKNAANKIK